MEVCYKITFQPRTQEDYAVDLIAVTEREKFVVPIRATGVRVRPLPSPESQLNHKTRLPAGLSCLAHRVRVPMFRRGRLISRMRWFLSRPPSRPPLRRASSCATWAPRRRAFSSWRAIPSTCNPQPATSPWVNCSR